MRHCHSIIRDSVSDIKAVIADLHDSFPGLPVWVIGTSTGSVSAAQAGTIPLNDPGTPDGIVLTSSVTEPQNTENVLKVALRSIRVPTLIVSNAQDACPNTPPKDNPNQPFLVSLHVFAWIILFLLIMGASA